MVLNNENNDNPGLRLILGIIVIAVSIYVFYIGIAKKNTPALFACPESIEISESPCTTVSGKGFFACIPEGMEYRSRGDSLYFYSIQPKIRGNIELIDSLPREQEWRLSLNAPLTRTFLGDIDSMDNFELMGKILESRWNPSLMGPKATLLPPWHKISKESEILVPLGSKAFIFQTPEQGTGIVFAGDKVALVNISGSIHRDMLPGIAKSINLK